MEEEYKEPTFAEYMTTAGEVQTELITSSPPQIEAAIANGEKNGLPEISINNAQGQFLSILCRAVNAKNILEIGALAGHSTIWLASSVPGVKVTSIEYDAKHHRVASENTQSFGTIDIIHGAALDVLPQLEKEGRVFDFVFIDADWENQAPYYDWAVKLTRSGGLIMIDNALKQIGFAMGEGDPKARVLIEHAKKNDGASPTLIPIVHPRTDQPARAVDGFLLAVVK